MSLCCQMQPWQFHSSKVIPSITLPQSQPPPSLHSWSIPKGTSFADRKYLEIKDLTVWGMDVFPVFVPHTMQYNNSLHSTWAVFCVSVTEMTQSLQEDEWRLHANTMLFKTMFATLTFSEDVHVTEHVCRSEGNLRELALSFHHVNTMD